MRTKRIPGLLVLLALAVAMPAVNASPAGAQSVMVGVVEGTGTIAPGLTTVPTYQTWDLSSAAIMTAGVFDGVVAAGSSSCGIRGATTIPATVAVSAGVGIWACTTGPLAGESGGLTYVRSGPEVSVLVAGSLTGELTCHFQPAAGQNGVTVPVTSFVLTCAGVGAGT